MTKYHISPSTGRPNKCTADKRPCPVGGEHFPTKEAAQQELEAVAKEENSTFVKLKKAPSREISSAPEISREDRFKSLMNSNVGRMIPEKLQSDITDDLRSYADYSYPGCPGCDGSDGDYCRCKVYDGGITVTSEQLAADFYHRNSKSRNYKAYINLSSDEQKVVKDIAELFDKHGISDTSGYEIDAEDDIYGQYLRSISVKLPEKFEDLQKDLEDIFKEEDKDDKYDSYWHEFDE